MHASNSFKDVSDPFGYFEILSKFAVISVIIKTEKLLTLPQDMIIKAFIHLTSCFYPSFAVTQSSHRFHFLSVPCLSFIISLLLPPSALHSSIILHHCKLYHNTANYPV